MSTANAAAAAANNEEAIQKILTDGIKDLWYAICPSHFVKKSDAVEIFPAAPLSGSCYLSVFFFLLTNTAASNTTHPETQITAIHFAMFVLSPVFGIAFT